MAQRHHKLAQLHATLPPLGDTVPLAGWIEGKRSFAYRNRVRIKITESDWSFFNSNKSRHCGALEETLLSALQELSKLWPSFGKALHDTFHHAEVRAADADGRFALSLSPHPDRTIPNRVCEDLREALGQHWLLAAGDATGPVWPCQRQWLRRNVFALFALGSFQQINSEVNRLLIAHLVNGAQSRDCYSFVDLFAGCGNFALPLAALGLRGTAVEISDEASSATRRAAELQGFNALSCVSASVSAYLAGSPGLVDLVVVDPPRAGLKDGVGAVAARAGRYLALCSCNPATLAPDLERLVALGFELEELTAFDMFPHTEHVEVVAWLRRRYR